MNISRQIVLLILMPLLFSSCIDEIVLDIDADQRKLVVDGLIGDSLDTYQVKLSYSSVIGQGNDNIQQPVSGATVRVLDDQGNEFLFRENEAGIYVNQMKAVLGNSYFLDIQMREGRHIQSRPQQLRKSPKIDTAKVEVVVRDYINSSGNFTSERQLQISIDTRLDEDVARPYLRWLAKGEYEFREMYPMALSTKVCYIPDIVGLNQLHVFDTGEVSGNELFDQEVITTLLNYRFAHQYCFHIFQYSISVEEFTYWNNVSNMINREGSLFDPPPGTVRGNIFDVDHPEESVVGYFSVSGVSYRRFFVNEDEIGFYVAPKCSASPRRPQYPECRECLSVVGSTTQRPDYWEF